MREEKATGIEKYFFIFGESGSSCGGIDMVPWAPYLITYTAGTQQTQAN